MAPKGISSPVMQAVSDFLNQLDDFSTIDVNIRLRVHKKKQVDKDPVEENFVPAAERLKKQRSYKGGRLERSPFSSAYRFSQPSSPTKSERSTVPRLCILEEHTERDDVSDVGKPEPSPFSQSDYVELISSYLSQLDILTEPRFCVISEDSKTDDVSNFSEITSVASCDQATPSPRKYKQSKKVEKLKPNSHGIGILEERTGTKASAASKYSSSAQSTKNSQSSSSSSYKAETISKARKHKDGKVHPFQAFYYDARIPNQTPREMWAISPAARTTKKTAGKAPTSKSESTGSLTYETSIKTCNPTSLDFSDIWAESLPEKRKVKSTRKGSSFLEETKSTQSNSGVFSRSSSGSGYSDISMPTTSMSERNKSLSKKPQT